MNYLYAKHDLENYPEKDILHLKKYYDISAENRNDLLWLLAIAILSKHKRSQMPPGTEAEELAKARSLLDEFSSVCAKIEGEITEREPSMPLVHPVRPLPEKKYADFGQDKINSSL